MSDYALGVTAIDNQDVDGRFDQRAVNVEDSPYKARPTATDNSTAINNAIDAAMDKGINAIWLPRRYPITSPIVPVSGLTMHGPNRKIAGLTATGPALQWSGAVSYLDMRGLKVSASGGHVFDAGDSGGLSQSVIFGCELAAAGASSSVYHQHGGSYIDVLVEACNLTHSGSATVPAWDIENGNAACNQNTWRRCRVNGGNNTHAPFFQINSTNTSQLCQDNVFSEITGEQNAGGLVHLYGCENALLWQVADYDASVDYALDLFRFAKSGLDDGSLASRGVTMIACGRHGGTRAEGVYDIYFDDGAFRVVLIACNQFGETALAIHAPTAGYTSLGTRDNAEIRNMFDARPLLLPGEIRHSGAKAGFFGAPGAGQAAAIPAPTGGATQDAEARTAISAIITVLKNLGWTA